MNSFKYFFAAILSLLCLAANAQPSKEVKLVVSGDGQTKEEATTNALRSAVEMAYGTFVSSNTQILDDEVTKDEVATISSGNVKSFKELGCIREDGIVSVSIEAVVSIGNLISYAKSKGAACEIAGQTFMQNMRIRELNKKNELTAIANLMDHARAISKEVFDVNLEIGDVSDVGNGFYSLPVTCILIRNENSAAFYKIVTETLKSMSLTSDEIKDYNRNNTPVYMLEIYDPMVEWDPFTPADGIHLVYAFRNDLSEPLCEILNMPYSDLSLTAMFSDGSSRVINTAVTVEEGRPLLANSTLTRPGLDPLTDYDFESGAGECVRALRFSWLNDYIDNMNVVAKNCASSYGSPQYSISCDAAPFSYCCMAQVRDAQTCTDILHEFFSLANNYSVLNHRVDCLFDESEMMKLTGIEVVK